MPDAIYNLVQSYPVMGGTGTQTNPLIITNAEQLNKIRQDLTAHYKLGANIDLSTITNWEPIGTEENPFTGTLDGDGYTISNLKINSSNNIIGLFGYIYKSDIKNLTLQNYSITTYGSSIGSLVGISNTSTITNVSAIGNIYYGTNSSWVGGLVGEFNSEYNDQAISKCYTEGTISCSRSATSTQYGSGIGGIVGWIGNYEDRKYVKIQNSYSAMDVIGNDCVGGLVGLAFYRTRIINTYAIGQVKAAGAQGGLVGGLEGESQSATNSYWIRETTGQATSELGTVKSVSALTKQATYNSWDFANTWTIEEGTSLAYLQGRSVPDKIQSLIKDYPVMGGLGTQASPFIITDAEQLRKVKQDLASYYKLGADVDLSAISNWEPIGTEEEPFIGNFDGAGYTIKNMKINSAKNFQGLFGYIYKATIQNVKLENYQIIATGTYIGGLTGYCNTSTITNVRAIGNNKIQYGTNSEAVGGLIGEVSTESGSRYITKCYTEGTIYCSRSATTTQYGGLIGGIIGNVVGGDATSRYIYLQNSYSNMSVIGNGAVGGLVGGISDYAVIQYCYATGKVTGASETGGIVGAIWTDRKCTSCYYDTATTAQEDNGYGTPKTTDEMKKQSTYSNWDFTNTWQIAEGQYPTLK